MKQSADILQILLTDGSWIGYACWVVMVLIGAQVIKMAMLPVSLLSWIWSLRRTILLNPTKWLLLQVLATAALLWAFRLPLSDQIQYIEQRYFNPAYTVSDTSRHTLAIYEAELAKRVDTYEFEITRRRTAEIALKIGSTPLAIYEVAYAECGLNPFAIRTDGVAAGWIQFTRGGLHGLTIRGAAATLEAVKSACRSRDIETIMDLTEAYLVSRAAGRPLPRAVDVYVCVFAPGHIGKPDETVLYQGFNNPSYYMNAGLDGYYTTSIGGQTRIFQRRSARDGRITINDLALALQAKKSRLIFNQ